MPSPVRRETHKTHVERKPKSLMKSSYLNRPYDFLLGTKTGQFVSIMVMWVFLVFLGALFSTGQVDHLQWILDFRSSNFGTPFGLPTCYLLISVRVVFNHIPQILRRQPTLEHRYTDRNEDLRFYKCPSRGCDNLTRGISISARHIRCRCRYRT